MEVEREGGREGGGSSPRAHRTGRLRAGEEGGGAGGARGSGQWSRSLLVFREGILGWSTSQGETHTAPSSGYLFVFIRFLSDLEFALDYLLFSLLSLSLFPLASHGRSQPAPDAVSGSAVQLEGIRHHNWHSGAAPWHWHLLGVGTEQKLRHPTHTHTISRVRASEQRRGGRCSQRTEKGKSSMEHYCVSCRVHFGHADAGQGRAGRA